MNTNTQLVNQFEVMLGTAGGWFTKKWLLGLKLDCGDQSNASFDDFVVAHFDDISFLPPVRIEAWVHSAPEQALKNQYLTLSETVGRLAWLIEEARRGECTVLSTTNDNIVVVYDKMGGQHELRISFDSDADWCIALDPWKRLRFSAGDQFLSFTKPC